MPKLTDKLIKEAVEEFDKTYKESLDAFVIKITMSDDSKAEVTMTRLIGHFLETKIRQAVDEVKERLTIESKKIFELTPDMGKAEYHEQTLRIGYNQAAKDLEELKKTI